MSEPIQERKARPIEHELREALKRLPGDERQRVRKVLHELGVLHDDQADEKPKG